MAISVRLDQATSKRLAAAAQARGVSKSALVRQCIDRFLTETGSQSLAWELGKRLFGCFDSGVGDLSIRAEEIARERIHARHVRKVRR